VVHVWNDPGTWWGNHWVYLKDNRYTANELSIDGFASFSAAERRIEDLFDTDIRDGKWGGGAGVNYFITRELGLSGDFNSFGNGGHFVDSISGSLVVRIPIDPVGLAPYFYGGGTRLTNPWEWAGHVGVGLEYRFNPGMGVFADARYTFPDRVSDYLTLRTGIRFVF